MADRTEQLIRTLEPRTAEAAFWLVWAARSVGYPVVITSARRSRAEQRSLVARGLSQTLDSKHLQGKAFDIDWLGTSRDQIPRWFWQLIGPWAETNLGLKWGGRWRRLWDPGHFESA